MLQEHSVVFGGHLGRVFYFLYVDTYAKLKDNFLVISY